MLMAKINFVEKQVIIIQDWYKPKLTLTIIFAKIKSQAKMKERYITMNKLNSHIHKIIAKISCRECLLYLIFGVLTTIISIGTFNVLNRLLKIHYLLTNAIAWVLAVLFAYIANKLFVFESKCDNIKQLFKEFLYFVSSRILSLGIEEMGLFILIDFFAADKNLSKLSMQFIVVIINYFFGKFIFKKRVK